jgi:hypothetical protein
VSDPTQLASEDRLRDEVIAAIAKSGKCYTNEARSMATELIGLRSRSIGALRTETQPDGSFILYFGNTP